MMAMGEGIIFSDLPEQGVTADKLEPFLRALADGVSAPVPNFNHFPRKPTEMSNLLKRLLISVSLLGAAAPVFAAEDRRRPQSSFPSRQQSPCSKPKSAKSSSAAR